MAKPERNFDHRDDENYWQPAANKNSKGDKGGAKLRSINGEGKGNGVPTGKLKAVDLKDAEKNSTNMYSSSNDAEKNALEAAKKIIGKVPRRNKAVIGGTTGIVVSLLVFFFTILGTAPFQFVQLSEKAKEAFASQNLMSNRRTGAWMRKYRWGGKTPYIGSRLGVIGNRIANNVEDRLLSKGIELITSPDGGVLKGVKVDGKIVAEFDGSDGNKARRDFTKAKISEATGWSKSKTALMTRPSLRRYDVSFRPFGNVIRKADESLDKFQDRVRNEKERRITDTSFDYDATQRKIKDLEARTDLTTDQKAQLEALKADSAEFDRLSQAGRDAYDSTSGDHNTKLKAAASAVQTTVSSASLIAMLLAMSCLVDSLSNSFKTDAFENILLPTSRMAGEGIASGDQIKDGKTINAEELNVHQESLYDELSDTSWADSAGFGGNVPIPNEYKLGLKGISTVETVLQTVEKSLDGQAGQGVGLLTENKLVCNVATSPWTGWGLFVVEVTATVLTAGLFGGVLGAGRTAASALLKEVLTDYVAGKAISGGSSFVLSALIGKVVPVLAKGALYGSIVSVGAHYAANEASRASGGTSLSSEQSAALDSRLRDLRIERDNERGFAYKYLNLNNPYSLASSAYRSASGKGVENVVESMASLISAPLKIAGSLLSGKVFAQTDTAIDYVSSLGSEKISFSLDEIFPDDPTLQDPFLAEQYVVDNNLKAKYTGCLKSPVESFREGALDELEGFWQSPMPNLKNCDYPDTPEEEYDYSVFRVAHFDELNLLSLGCLEGDEVSCQELGVNEGSTTALSASIPGSSTIVGNPYESSVDVACATGTRDLGVHPGYVKGVETQMRLCALTGFNSTRGSTSESNPSSQYYVEGANGDGIVNSRVSGAWYSLIQAAKADGIELSGTQSFRTKEHQEFFWNRNPDPNKVAQPGYSSHQAGVAIDFYGMSTEGGKTCASRATNGSAGWQWLFNNAEKFGFKQYSFEAWHWDALNSANRCGGP